MKIREWRNTVIIKIKLNLFKNNYSYWETNKLDHYKNIPGTDV